MLGIFNIKRRNKPKLHKIQVNSVEVLNDIREELTITNNNIRYIRAMINTLKSNINCIKGESARETRERKDGIRNRIEWYTIKLEEEKVNLVKLENEYNKLLKQTGS